MRIELNETAALLKKHDRILILAHAKPDGDTIGSAYALYHALRLLGKTAAVKCADPIPTKFMWLVPPEEPAEFEPEYITAVDVADKRLLGGLESEYGEKVDLCVDHHRSNKFYAKKTLLGENAANGELVYLLIKELGITPNIAIANALFTAITSDTGGFRYADVSAQTHRIAADLIELGADHAAINRSIFETKSRARASIDRLMLETMQFYFDGCCAMIYIPASLKADFEVGEEDLDGISSMPRTIEGVYAGVTLRENTDKESFRVSIRSQSPFDASSVCGILGGGGHKNAAGTTMHGSLDDVREGLLAHIRAELEQKGIWTA